MKPRLPVNPRLLGDEMTCWSDLDGSHGPGPVRGAVLVPLLSSASGRILVAGPHHPTLVDALVEHGVAPIVDVTVLVRGVPDAKALADRYAGHPGVTVCCGSPDALAAETAFDTVVALDGLDRLACTESPQPTWEEAFGQLMTVLRPGGRLLLTMANPLGVHRLTALPGEPADEDWAAAGEYDPTRPAGLGQLGARLRGVGLRVAGCYAAYPVSTAPTLLLGERIVDEQELTGFLEASLRRACALAADVWSDPGRWAAGALRQGVATDLAPAWILVADAPLPDTEPSGAGLPGAVVARGAGWWDVRQRADGRWVRGAEGAGAEVLPVGRTLEFVLLGACLRRDMPAVRGLLVGWQGGPTAGVAAGQVVVGPDGGLTGLVPAGEPGAALRDFAATVLRGGFPQPWPAPADEADLVTMLAAMAGCDPAPVPDCPPTPAVHAVDELVAARDRLARELAAARAKAIWYEQTLTARDDALKRAQRTVELLSGAGPARLGMAFVGGVRAARRRVRVVVRHARPQR